MRRLLVSLLIAALLATVAPPLATAQQSAGVSPLDVAPEDFVDQQYQDFLARGPDAGGLAFWAARLRGGEDPASLIETMVNTPEFANRVAPLVRLYYAHLQRSPELDGLKFWVGQLGNGWTITDVSNFFADSPEFEARYGSLTNAEYVERVYQNVLGRGSDDVGRAYWIEQLDGGLKRGTMMAQFSEGPEFKKQTDGLVRATMLYIGMLRRAPDPQGVEFWAGQIDAGVPYSNVMAGFLYSPEYANRMATLFPDTNPLTGEATAALRDVPALAVKVDNVEKGRPQAGINDADVVYEIVVEGNFTRLLALYQSHDPGVIGPVRSVRTSDFDLLDPLNKPLLSASGANSNVLTSLGNRNIITNVNAIEAGSAYFRDSGRTAPDNLFARSGALRAAGGNAGDVPPMLFDYRASTDPSEGVASNGITINFGSSTTSYAWNGTGWVRTMNGTVHVDTTGRAITPENVVVMVTPYEPSLADSRSPHAITVGEAQVFILSDGKVIQGVWSRPGPEVPIGLFNADLEPVLLTPGNTWVHLAPPGAAALN